MAEYISTGDLLQDIFPFREKKLAAVQLAKSYKICSCDDKITSDSNDKVLYEKKSKNVFYCGSDLTFAVSNWGEEFEEKKLIAANFCKDRLCPMCDKRRSLRNFYIINKLLCEAVEEGYTYLFSTYTIKNSIAGNLADEIKLMQQAFNRMYDTELYKHFKGYIRVLEVTYNSERKDFHPHFHVLYKIPVSFLYHESKPDIKKKYFNELTRLWLRYFSIEYDKWYGSGSFEKNYPKRNDKSFIICKHVECYSKNDNYSGTFTNTVNFSDVAAELGKYVSKEFKFVSDPFAVFHISKGLRSKRMLNFGGEFKELKKLLQLHDADDDGSLVFTNDEKLNPELCYMVVKYKWNFNLLCYSEYIDPEDPVVLSGSELNESYHKEKNKHLNFEIWLESHDIKDPDLPFK